MSALFLVVALMPTPIVAMLFLVLSLMPRTVMSSFLHSIHKDPTLCGISDEIGATNCASTGRQELGIASGRDELLVPTRRRHVYSAHLDYGNMAAKWYAPPRPHSPAMLETSCPIVVPPTDLSGPPLGTVVSAGRFRHCSISDESRLAGYWTLIVADGDTAAHLTTLPRHHDATGVETDLDACKDRFALDNREGDPTTW